jgi:hypothetical protein
MTRTAVCLLLAATACEVAALLNPADARARIVAPRFRVTRLSQLRRAQTVQLRRQRQLQRQQQKQQRQQQQQQRQQQQNQKQQEDLASLKWQTQTLDELDKIVDLTADQKATIEPIIADTAKQIEQSDLKTNLSTQKKREADDDIKQRAWQQIEPLLTAQQQDAYHANKLLASMDLELTLTSDQKAGIKKILAEQVQQNQHARDDKNLSELRQQRKLEEIDDTTWAKVDTILTAPQRDKMYQKRQTDLLYTLASGLQLDTERKEKIKTIIDDAAKRIQETRDSEAPTMAKRNAKLHDIREQMWKDIRTELTAEQQTKFDAMRTAKKKSAPASSKSGST